MSSKLNTRRPAKKVSFEVRVLLLVLMSGFPGVVVTLWWLWSSDFSVVTSITSTFLLLLCWLGFGFAARQKVRFPLQTLANLLAGMREGDFSTRARGACREDAMGELVIEINTLADTLREQRLGAMEAMGLLRTVMTEIEVAVFTLDQSQRLCLVNRAGEKLLARSSEHLLRRRADEIGLSECLNGEPVQTIQATFPGGIGRWGIRRTSFRQGGLPHQLVVLTDLSRALRDEERQAWQRLVRVLGHELNNSLAPIKSIAGSLEQLVKKPNRPGDWEEDMHRGLAIISSRAESLTRFMEAYASVARLPPPKRKPVSVSAWVSRVAHVETRMDVEVVDGGNVSIQGDIDQLDQMLINLVRNATDASIESEGGVSISWKKNGAFVEVMVRDEGNGLAGTANLFVPFFTTKPKGTGIGLVLSRQIAEAHGGTLTLENRMNSRGCEARIRLPL
ncbi:MAG: multi-sensor signal transduction histidine kinase [Verrucomicrobiales bacterium]|nr:multi-sensor signal transduction histidine kinase [Verrucomicrobiales bacterium]